MPLLMNMWLIGATTWLSHQFLLHVGYAIKSRNLFRTQGCTLWSSEESLIAERLSVRHIIVQARWVLMGPYSEVVLVCMYVCMYVCP